MFQKLVTVGLGEGNICSSQQKGLAKVMLRFLPTVGPLAFLLLLQWPHSPTPQPQPSSAPWVVWVPKLHHCVGSLVLPVQMSRSIIYEVSSLPLCWGYLVCSGLVFWDPTRQCVG